MIRVLAGKYKGKRLSLANTPDMRPTLSRVKKSIFDSLGNIEGMNVLDLLLKMRTSHIHMAVVVDEHGGLDGLVTIEDLVEIKNPKMVKPGIKIAGIPFNINPNPIDI